jgi:hypothetical protein
VTPEFLEYLRKYFAKKYYYSSLVYGSNLQWNSYLDIIKNEIRLILQFILSPLPILHNSNPLRFLSAFIDSLYCLHILLFSLLVNKRILQTYLISFTIGTLFFSIWEFHIGGAVRHRMPLISLLLPPASLGILLFLRRLKNGFQNTNIHYRR